MERFRVHNINVGTTYVNVVIMYQHQPYNNNHSRIVNYIILFITFRILWCTRYLVEGVRELLDIQHL